METLLEKRHCQKLVELSKGHLSISNRSYYSNLSRLDDFIDNFKDEIADNCLKMKPESKADYFDALLVKLRNISIDYDEKILEQKLEKYRESKSSFPDFTNEALNQILHRVPSKPVQEFQQEQLAMHSITVQVQKAFFRYWMKQQIEDLITWLEQLSNKVSAGENSDPRATQEGLTLTQWILVGTQDETLTAADNFYGKHLARHLSQLWRRPQNKIAAVLKKWDDPSHEWMKTPAYHRDMRIAQEYISRFRAD